MPFCVRFFGAEHANNVLECFFIARMIIVTVGFTEQIHSLVPKAHKTGCCWEQLSEDFYCLGSVPNSVILRKVTEAPWASLLVTFVMTMKLWYLAPRGM